jgi:signal transduction histidine kinase
MKSTTVPPVVHAAIETVTSSAEAKGIKIITNFEDVQTPINGDPHRLQQIVWNLLSNAVKFTPPEGRIEVSLHADGNDVQIQVTDTGIGIPPDFLPYIFDRFRQGSDVGSKMRSGLGLGLTIVRHLVELHSGSIHAASAGRGKGAVFTLRFPFVARRAVTATFGAEK